MANVVFIVKGSLESLELFTFARTMWTEDTI